MTRNVDVSGAWQIKQENGFLVDLVLHQNEDGVLDGTATHSGERVRSTSVDGTARGEKVELVIQWNNNTRGKYTSEDHLVGGHFTGPDQGILKGKAFDEVNPHVTTNWESLRSFSRVN